MAMIPAVSASFADTTPAASTKVKLGGIFGGNTSKGWPVVIKVSRNGKRVTEALAGMSSSCTTGADLVVSDGWRNLVIRARRFTGTYSESDTQGSLVFQSSGTITGRLNRKRTRITGTWTQKVTIRETAGAIVDTCDSGRVTYTARR
jgi:hypothetical protein